MIHRYLNLRQVAEAMRVSPSWLRRNLAGLERDRNFPSAVPGMGTRRDASAIDLWQQNSVPPALRRLSEGGSSPDALALWRTELDRRADALAQADRLSAEIATNFGKDLLKARLVRPQPRPRSQSREDLHVQ